MIDTSHIAYYSKDDDTIYINTDCLLPFDGKSEILNRYMRNCLKLSIQELIEWNASDDEKEVICELLHYHPGCKVSEFCEVY